MGNQSAECGKWEIRTFKRRKNDACRASKSGTGFRGAGWKLHFFLSPTVFVSFVSGFDSPPFVFAAVAAIRFGILASASFICALIFASSFRRAASAFIAGNRSSVTACGMGLALNGRWNLLCLSFVRVSLSSVSVSRSCWSRT